MDSTLDIDDVCYGHPVAIAELAELRVAEAERDKLREVLGRIEKGCSFPNNDVERAIRDVARAALRGEARSGDRHDPRDVAKLGGDPSL